MDRCLPNITCYFSLNTPTTITSLSFITPVSPTLTSIDSFIITYQTYVFNMPHSFPDEIGEDHDSGGDNNDDDGGSDVSSISSVDSKSSFSRHQAINSGEEEEVCLAALRGESLPHGHHHYYAGICVIHGIRPQPRLRYLAKGDIILCKNKRKAPRIYPRPPRTSHHE